MDLDALTGQGTYRDQPGGVAAQPSQFVEATIATTPATVTDEVYVFLNVERARLAPDQAPQRVGPCRWEPRPIDGGLLFPKRDDRALVVTSDTGHRHIVWWEPTTASPLLVSALPPSPRDGQEIYFQTMAMATDGVPPWRLRYRALDPDGSPNTSAYRWECLAAAPLIATAAASEACAIVTAITDFTGGPSKALPLTGDYMVEVGGLASHTGTNQGVRIIPVATGLAGSVANGAFLGQPGTANSSASTISRLMRGNGISGTLRMGYFVGIAGGTVQDRWITATPVRLG